jgi:hypothetical protein
MPRRSAQSACGVTRVRAESRGTSPQSPALRSFAPIKCGLLGGLAVSGGGGGARWTRRCSTMWSPPKDTITQLAECLHRRADRYRLREFGIHESDGSPEEKEGRPKHQPPGYQACMMARRNVASASGESFPPDASPPRCAQLMGLASRGCLALVLGATAERRNLLFRFDLSLPWIRT